MKTPLFASDLDGTLLGPDSKLSATTVDALARVRALGAEVVAVTGRSPMTALGRLRRAASIETALCNNGAIEVEVRTGDVISAAWLDTTRLAALVDQLTARWPNIAFAWETNTGFGTNAAFRELGLTFESNGPCPETLPDPAELQTTKVAVALAGTTPIELYRMINLQIESDFEFATSGAPFLEVTATNKGAALAEYCRHREIDRAAVVAYGDNHNDVSMLRWAGTGIAMGNAHESATEAADMTIGNNDDDAAALDMLARAERSNGLDHTDGS